MATSKDVTLTIQVAVNLEALHDVQLEAGLIGLALEVVNEVLGNTPPEQRFTERGDEIADLARDLRIRYDRDGYEGRR